MNKFILGLVSGMTLYAGGKVLSKVADKNPKMKVVKDKITKTGQEFAENIKDVAHSVVDACRSKDLAVEET